MSTPIESLIATGTKLWLDSVEPQLVKQNRALGATGATSNPIIISGLIKTGDFDQPLADLLADPELSVADAAWRLTDQIVKDAQAEFLPVWKETAGNDGWVSFELDPLLEDADCTLSTEQRAARYIELGKQWSAGCENRMIKIPATPAGLAAIEELAAAGVTLNVTLIFSERQYQEARDAAWRGAQRRGSLDAFKSVYSIFVSRIDVYTEQHVAQLSDAAQGQVGTVNAKRLWSQNQEFWSDKATKLDQEIVFASTGTKKPEDPPWKYVAALAGSDIQTNPPATNEAVQESGQSFTRQVDQLPPDEVLAEIDREVDFEHLERILMEEGLKKFADPQRALLELVESRRADLG
ncbi:Transaldolase [Posidoniimonas polymericola]|uniref:Transaldolase n=1 Tax=Posidoniimonas polymericola TaxID=2528002 RepID=A0A5C5YTH6_9BACT|nr:transaldolase family protein [Posidoniimonas polymericola]TWT78289.1 Transaldolase [Posidoniimonas polymericola]